MKRNLKKLLCFLLSVIMVMGTTTTAFAGKIDEDSSTPAVRDTSSINTGETFYYNADTGEMIAENGEPYAFDDVEIQLPVSSAEDGISLQGTESYIVRGGLKKTSGGVFTWWFNTDCPTSPIIKPNIRVTVQLQGGFTNGSSFSNVGGSVYHNYTSNIDYGVDYTWTSTAKTGYYRMKFTINDYNAGQTVVGYTTTNLWNRTGHVWNFSFSDSASGKSLPKPPANYPKGATSSRDPNVSDEYYKTYTNTTGKTLNRSLYDVHHIRPLAYGGSNDYSNLIHLPKATHTSVTGWWAGY